MKYRFPRGNANPACKKVKKIRVMHGRMPFLFNPDHPNANTKGYVKEAVSIAAAALGRGMPDGSIVHHWDRDPGNNKPSNLLICQDQAYHRLIHRRMMAMEVCGHPDWLKCVFCGRYSQQSEMVISKRKERVNSNRWYHQACNTLYAKNYRVSAKR